MGIEDLEDEMRDIVHDYENSKALVHLADKFLNNENDIDEGNEQEEEQDSVHSLNTNNPSKIHSNKKNVGMYDPYRIKLL
jgi:hypothetical protein